VDGMNSTWWPLDLTNETLYQQVKITIILKYNNVIHVDILFQKKSYQFFYATSIIIVFNTSRNMKPIQQQQHCRWIHPSCSYYKKYNMLISKLIYYDEKSILLGAHQVKIISYSLSRLEINVPIHEKQKL
jgi:hypothetical protein